MTPVIDIVFQLIIFFLVVCRFIEAQNFPVTVPDSCKFAVEDSTQKAPLTTVTVMKTAEDKIDFAVGSQKITVSTVSQTIEKLTELINMSLTDLPSDQRIVTLRIDKDICFAKTQYALAAVAASNASSVKLTVLKQQRNNP